MTDKDLLKALKFSLLRIDDKLTEVFIEKTTTPPQAKKIMRIRFDLEKLIVLIETQTTN